MYTAWIDHVINTPHGCWLGAASTRSGSASGSCTWGSARSSWSDSARRGARGPYRRDADVRRAVRWPRPVCDLHHRVLHRLTLVTGRLIAQFWYGSAPLQWNSIEPYDRRFGAPRHVAERTAVRCAQRRDVRRVRLDVPSRSTTTCSGARSPRSARPRLTATPEPRPIRPGRRCLGTPPVPDYDSAHSVQGGAASAALRSVLGTGKIEFSTCSMTLPAGSRCTDASPVLRHYTSLAQAAVENASSRVYAGIHFRDAT